MDKEITITNANNQHKFICFRLKGLKDGIMVGLYPNNDGLSIAYKGDVVGVPFNADSGLIDELNDNSFPKKDEIENNWLYDTTWKLGDRNIIDSKLSGPVNATTYPLKTKWEIKADDDIGYWQPDQVTELDDEAFDAFEKEIMNSEPDMERVEAAKKIFEGVDKINVEMEECNFSGCPISRAIDILKELVGLDMMSQSGDCNEIREKAKKLLFDIGAINKEDIKGEKL